MKRTVKIIKGGTLHTAISRIRTLVKYALLHHGPAIAQKLLSQLVQQTTGLSESEHQQLHNWSTGSGIKKKKKKSYKIIYKL
jgi:hypothetical protein